MDLTLSEALDQTRKELAETRAHIARLMEHADRLTETIAALEFAQEFLRKRSDSEATAPLGPREWLLLAETHRLRDLRRTDAIHDVLRQSSIPLAPREIARVLRQSGRTDTQEEVGATLGYLKKEGRANTVAHGKWVVSSGNAGTRASHSASTASATKK